MTEKIRILIVEDESLVAEDLKDMLLGFGYEVPGIAKNGEKAIALAGEHQPDLVLMDINLLGEMDGITAGGEIRSRWGIPIIYVTAFASPEIIDRAKKTVPSGYILKPFNERQIQTAIEIALYNTMLEREIKKRDNILFAVSSATEWLLRISHMESPANHQPRNFNSSDMQNIILEPIGLALDAGAICIFKESSDPSGSETVSLIYEWGCPAHQSCLNKPELKKFTYGTLGLSRWHDLLMKGEIITATMSTLPKDERMLLSLLGVQSGVLLPIFIDDDLWGFTGFFDLVERTRSPDEVEALRITTHLLGAAMGYR